MVARHLKVRRCIKMITVSVEYEFQRLLRGGNSVSQNITVTDIKKIIMVTKERLE